MLVDGHEVDDWAATLDRMLADPGLRAELGRRAVRHARSFGWGATTERLLQAYGEACRTRTPSPIFEASLLTGVPAAVVP